MAALSPVLNNLQVCQPGRDCRCMLKRDYVEPSDSDVCIECPQGAQASHTNVMLHLKINCPDDFRIAPVVGRGAPCFHVTLAINKTSSAQMGMDECV
jgi:hypothetical protein